MKQEVDFKEIEQKAFRDSQQDGLLEFVMGMCLLIMSTRLISRVLIVMFPLAMLLFKPVLEALRKQFTYPRIGYVKLIPDKPKDTVGAIAVVTLIVIAIMAVAFVLFANVRDFNLWLKWVPVWGGTVLAGMFCSFASKSGAPRYYAYALWSVITGLALSIIKFEPIETGTLLYFLVMGALLIPCGMVLFIRFLRKYPETVKEAQNDNI
ncbi:MAG: hypothetical protein ACYS6W_14735 [Planctomycetota bacterium]|jgi:hypothetical protein